MCILYPTVDKGIFWCMPFISISQLGFICAREKHADFFPTHSNGIEYIIIKQVLSWSSQLLESLPSYQPSDFRIKRLQSKSILLVQPTIVRVISSLFSNVFTDLEESLSLSSRYVSLILVPFLLRIWYSHLIFVLSCSSVVGSRLWHQCGPVILSRFLTVFSLIFVSVSFLFMSREYSRTLSWSSLTLQDDWIFGSPHRKSLCCLQGCKLVGVLYTIGPGDVSNSNL